MTEEVPALAPDEFSTMLARERRLVMVEFWAAWCGPCKEMNPWVARLAREGGDKLRVVRLDIDEPGADKLAARYQVKIVPLLLFFRHGQPVYRLIGFQTYEEIAARLEELLVATA